MAKLKITGNGFQQEDQQSLSYSGGILVQTAYAEAGPVRQTISSITPIAVTDLSIDFIPMYADSTIFIRANMQCTRTNYVQFAVYKDGTKTGDTSGGTNNAEDDMQLSYYLGNMSGDQVSMPIMHFEDALNTDTRTYDIRGRGGTLPGTAIALYINDRGSNNMAGFSQMFVMEFRNDS